MDAALVVRDLTAGYGSTYVLHGVCVKVPVGSLVAVLGPNGAGKSTLLKSVFGLTRKHSGSVELSGRDVTESSPHDVVKEGAVYVPQLGGVFPSMTIIENLEMAGYTLPIRQVAERVGEALDLFPDLALARHRKAGTLSVGQRTMLGMARAVMTKATLVLLDEPTAGVAPKYVDVIWGLIHTFRERGVAAIISEQNVRRTLQEVDWTYVLVDGRNRLDGRREVLDAEAVTASFLGRPE